MMTDLEEVDKTIYIISDFQKNTFDPDEVSFDTSVQYKLIPIEGSISQNVYIDSCWFVSPIRKINEKEELNVKIRNESEEDYVNIPVKIYVNGEAKAPGVVSVNAKSESVIQMAYTVQSYGEQACEVSIRDHPIVFDDHYFINYRIDSVLKVLVIKGKEGNLNLKPLFNDEDGIDLVEQSVDGLDFGDINNYNLLVLDELKDPSSGLAETLLQFFGSRRQSGNTTERQCGSNLLCLSGYFRSAVNSWNGYIENSDKIVQPE